VKFLETHPDGDKKSKPPIGALRIFVPVIELKNKGVEQRIEDDRNSDCKKRVGSVWILRPVKPACGYDVPDQKADIGKSENKTAFVFDSRKFRNVVFHHQQRNEGEKDEERDSVGGPGNAEEHGRD